MRSFAKSLIVFGAAIGLFASVGCSKNNFPEYIALTDLRIVTITVDKPEANPGDTVTLTPVLSDVVGQGRALTFNIQGCIDPGVGIGATATCRRPDPATVSTGTVSPPPGANSTFTGPVASFTITLPDATAMFLGRSTQQQFNGVAYLVFYSIAVPGGPSVNSFVRIIVSVSTKLAKNQNPVMDSVDMNKVPITGVIGMPRADTSFRVTSPGDSAEGYQVMQKDGSVTTQYEQLTNTWFISDGSFDFYRTLGNSENNWTPPSAIPSGRGVVFLVVTRDGRGGASFKKIEMN